MRTAIYVRISSDKTGEGHGIARQREDCQRLADARGWSVTHIIEDNDTSASTGMRPGFEQLLALMSSGQIDAVVVWHVDRLLRKMTDLERVIELVERHGVRLATVTGDIDLSTDMGRMVGRIMASVARAEVERKSARQVRANAQRAAAGAPHGSRRPFGYEMDQLTVRESEAVLLRSMASRVLSGWSCKEVAYWLNEQGHVTTTGRPWLAITVRNMLRRPRYGGIRAYRGAEYSAQWPAIFDAETYERLQLVLAEKRSGPAARKYLLTGLLVCGVCGSSLIGQRKRDRPSAPVRRSYRCNPTGYTEHRGGCGGVRRGAEPLEHFVKSCVLYRLDSPELAGLLGDSGHLRQVLGQRDLVKRRLDALVDDYATGLLDRAQFTRAKSLAETELARLEAEAHKARGLSVPLGQTLEQAWDGATDNWRRELLGLLIKRVVVNPGQSKPFYVINGVRYRFAPELITIEWRA